MDKFYILSVCSGVIDRACIRSLSSIYIYVESYIAVMIDKIDTRRSKRGNTSLLPPRILTRDILEEHM
jgi:hypothetical protein